MFSCDCRDFKTCVILLSGSSLSLHFTARLWCFGFFLFCFLHFLVLGGLLFCFVLFFPPKLGDTLSVGCGT